VGTTIGFYPSATTATIVNVDPTPAIGGAAVANAGLTYGLKLTGNTDTVSPLAVYVDGPSTGRLFVERVAAATVTPAANPTVGAATALGGGTVTGTVTAGQNTVTTSGATMVGGGVAVDDYLKIDTGAAAEWARVTAVALHTLTVDRPLAGHAGGTALNFVASASVDATHPAFLTTNDETTSWVPSYVNGDSLFLGATVPGTYTVKFGKDTNQDHSLSATDDDITSAFTLVVKDVTTNASYTTAGSDLDFGLTTTPNPVDKGRAVSIKATPGVTGVDARGNAPSATVGALGTNLAADMSYTATGGGANVTGDTYTVTYDGTAFTRLSDTTDGTADVVITPHIATTGDTYAGPTATSTVNDNLVNALTLAVGSGQETKVTAANATTGIAKVRPGTSSVTYTATAMKAGPLPVENAVVWFTLKTNLTGNIDGLSDLSVTGKTITPVPSTSTTIGEVSALTDANGVASITVTSSQTATADQYTVGAQSGTILSDNTAAGGASDPITTQYLTPAATVTSVGNLSAMVGGTATITGTVTDQWGQAYNPGTGVQATLNVTNGGTVRVTKTVDIADGAFTAQVSDISPAVGAHVETYTWTLSGGAPNTASSLAWQSSVTPATVTITAPTSTATPTLKKGTVALGSGTEVTGSLLDSANGGLAYQAVTLTGSEGVYFSTVATPGVGTTDNLTKTLATTANGSGVYDVWAFFTKPGAATVTVTSGTATKSVIVTVTDSIDPYQVIAIDSDVEIGKVGVVTGRVKDAFGNPVKNNWVSLSLGASTLGTLGAGEVRTNTDGIWSTSFTAGSTAGEATVTATLCDTGGASCTAKTAAPAPSSTWLNYGGMTIPGGAYVDQAKVMVGEPLPTTVMAPATHVVGAVKIMGKAKPGSSVEVYSKPAGTAVAFALVGVANANDSGDWSDTEYIAQSTIFYAKTSTSSSSPVTVTVVSNKRASVKVSARAMGKGVVKVSANGAPNKKGVITVYVNGMKVRSVNSNAAGDGTISVKTTKGKKTIKVVFSASGYTAGSTTVMVTVK